MIEIGKKRKPPFFAVWLLKYLEKDYFETRSGDFEEEYNENIRNKGLLKAYILYWHQVFASLPDLTKITISGRTAMFKNNIKIAYRSIRKNKVYSFINISGLALGMTVFLLIMMYVINEYSYDKFNTKIDRIYRIGFENLRQTYQAPAVGKEIRENIPEVQKMVRFKRRGKYLAKYTPDNNPEKIKYTKINDFAWVDNEVFDIFSFEFIAGEPAESLSAPFTIVLTESIAKTLFNEVNPVGKTLKINNRHNYTVTGVIKDPDKFHLAFDVLASFVTLGRTIGEHELTSYNSWNLQTYVLLPEDHDKSAVAQKITAHFKPIFAKMRDDEYIYDLYNLKGLYFQGQGAGRYGNLQFVYIFIAAAVFILLIACINYINLSTARASKRAKEIGIKKVVGSLKRMLVSQFLIESNMITIISFFISLLLLKLLLPMFNTMVSGDLSLDLFYQRDIILMILGGVLLIGLAAGLYPAVYLSAIKPLAVIKGEVTKGRKGIIFRRALIVLQFSISIILIIGTMVVFQQLDYVKNKELGFTKDPVMHIDLNTDLLAERNVFKEKLLSIPGIRNVSFSQGFPGRVFNWESFEHNGDRIGFAVHTIDPEFFDIYDFKFLDGRKFSWDIKSDEFGTCIMNEEAARRFNLDKPVGTIFHRKSWGSSSFPSKEIEVIGVVKDFHFQSLQEEIKPLLFSWNEGWLWTANIRISAGNISETLDNIRQLSLEMAPEFPFEYDFIDESFNSHYKAEERFGRIFGNFSALAIFIACMGLFGLVSFIVEQKTKEVGVRKVLGASISSIVLLLSREFTKWVIVANLIAWPITWFVMDKWLENFAYKVDAGVSLYIFAAILTILITAVTISVQTFKAARANPVESLRYE